MSQIAGTGRLCQGLRDYLSGDASISCLGSNLTKHVLSKARLPQRRRIGFLSREGITALKAKTSLLNFLPELRQTPEHASRGRAASQQLLWAKSRAEALPLGSAQGFAEAASASRPSGQRSVTAHPQSSRQASASLIKSARPRSISTPGSMQDSTTTKI